jgi:hypothetical protein
MDEPTSIASLVCGLWTITMPAHFLLCAHPHESHFAFAPIECQALRGALTINAEFRTESGDILVCSLEQPLESQRPP